MKNIFKFLLNLIYPEENICFICGEETFSDRKYICIDCINLFEKPMSEKICESFYFNELIYFCEYKDLSRKIMHKFKYGNQPYYYKFIGELILKELNEELILSIDAITSVPTSKKRKFYRGYDQAELIALYISENLNKPYLKNKLTRQKNTKPQSGKSKKERLLNVKDVFEIEKKSFEDKNILLIDDIFTTGATTNECSRMLKKAGARNITVAVFAKRL